MARQDMQEDEKKKLEMSEMKKKTEKKSEV